MNMFQRLVQLVEGLPDDGSAMLSRNYLFSIVEEFRRMPRLDPARDEQSAPEVRDGTSCSWRERLWTCPEDVRLTADEAAEALGMSRDWVYRRTSNRCPAEKRLPMCRIGGQLAFRAGSLREWLQTQQPSKREEGG